MKTSFKIQLKDLVNDNSSRSNAAKAFELIIEFLNKYNSIEINLADVNFTPSVADEVIGKLAETLGARRFKEKIIISNFSDAQMSLMRHVIGRRMSKKQTYHL
ncbi:hypothetical protein ELY21_00945 [Legionella sp. km535]|uniref:STAS-like domain-containing protein n=1 Tax=Legionella sp. km535 TaxID=2498107 RepID=UPI000F8DE0EA|nr:DUF4325 domain-containing protein [Legionella sp. km535]RUR20682.1 hypothetical protein ELY21_00945 [Legionella sp. km535]